MQHVYFLIAMFFVTVGVAIAQVHPLRAKNGMVVSAHVLASQAGIDVLKQGGNAIDAAVATGFALAVVYPGAGNLGGGGFMTIRLKDGTATTLDFREKAPIAATRNMYLDSSGNVIPEKSLLGHGSVGVPASPAGLVAAHKRFGKLPFAKVIAPAISLAENGFRLSQAAADDLNEAFSDFDKFESSRPYFTKGSAANVWQTGDLFVQKDLAKTLRLISKNGADGFYKGETATLIVAEMQRGRGLVTHEDLETYAPLWREPICGTYRGYDILSMPPPSSGGIGLVQLLNMVEPHNLSELGFHSSASLHLMGEAMRRVYADRATFLGDPDFVNVPTQPLISKGYATDRMKNFDSSKATHSTEIKHGSPSTYESTQTTHYSVVDADGNAVACTTTLNGHFGSFVAVKGAGFLLNNEMDDFSAKPDVPNKYGVTGGEANSIQPRKRMLSSMAPTIVTKDGKLFMVIGTPGGSTIITTVFQVVVNVIDFKMNIQEAVASPRVHHQWKPDVFSYEKKSLPKDVVQNLERRGWKVSEQDYSGRADGILFKDGFYYGGQDPRGEDAAVGY